MDLIRSDFRKRCVEITQYLRTVRFIEEHGSEIVSRDRTRHLELDTTTRHVLKASVFLHLYNLVESTVSACLTHVATEIESEGIGYADLTDEWRSTVLKVLGKTTQQLNPETRLANLVDVCERLLSKAPLAFAPTISGGNLDDVRIEALLKRHGIDLQLPAPLKLLVKKHVVDDNNPLKLVKLRRNELAHGLTSFGECGRGVTVVDLRAWTNAVIRYLRSIVNQFDHFVSHRKFDRTAP